MKTALKSNRTKQYTGVKITKEGNNLKIENTKLSLTK